MFMKLEGRSCLVVGAGTVGEPKISSLISAGASTRVMLNSDDLPFAEVMCSVPPTRRSIFAAPNQSSRRSGVVSAAHTLATGFV